ncbi:unnamed protein product [Brachionus calyciflorus]|uniref:Nose resistant-to-fluoxetine protein N-terminal domain-containing protein n=1 Tax=Brachionus calyciflorus TaxID=104777 RepID=A0A813XJL0_9BILA|nr:unnamed protein product [Brachionus calyciflorus]
MKAIFLIIAICCAYEVVRTERIQTFLPLNFRDGIIYLNQQRQNHRHLLKNPSNLTVLNDLDLNTNQFILETLNKFFEDNDQSDVSQDCIIQLEQFYHGLRNKRQWAIRVIDSFGKVPSGIMNGNTVWLGEFSECRNISAYQGNWTGKYVLIAKPLLSYDPQNALPTGDLKLGICVPNKCTQHDIYEIINFAISMVPEKVISSLPFNLKFNETYVGIRDDKVLSNKAIITLSILGSIVVLVLLCTLYDLIKRFSYQIKCQNLSNNSTVVVNSETDELISTTNQENQNIDNEESFMLSIMHEPIFSQILISISAYTNTKKLFKVNSSKSEDFKCFHAIRVLSLAWVILGHSYIFSLAFVDNIADIIPVLKRFSFLIVSNAFFSVDSFFFLSGFLTCYTFLKEIERRNNQITFLFMLKYYFHRFWRLTPAYVIAYFISLNLSGYMGNGPQYPETGIESQKCHNQWWANILYINNFYGPENFCFGISWYLANDFQFHFFAPIILIPLALKKVFIAFGISIVLLVVNIVATALNVYYRQIEAAQFGQNFGDFFLKFYILPWYRMGPYIIGLLVGYAVIITKKKKLKISRFLNLAMWSFSILLTGLVVFGLYPDALGENPLSREARIMYQSFSKIAWSFAIGYMIYSCIMSSGGIVNKILSWSIWVPLSRVNYSAFLIHILVMMVFNANQEHLIHFQDSNMMFYFLSECIFTYALAYLFNIFFEQPWVALEKFIFKR